MGFDPCNCNRKISGIHQDSNSQSGSSFESVKVHSFTLSDTPRSMRCDSWASLLALTFASPCLGCKAETRVATNEVGGNQTFVITHGCALKKEIYNFTSSYIGCHM
jgi:hypothetical protein